MTSSAEVVQSHSPDFVNNTSLLSSVVHFRYELDIELASSLLLNVCALAFFVLIWLVLRYLRGDGPLRYSCVADDPALKLLTCGRAGRPWLATSRFTANSFNEPLVGTHKTSIDAIRDSVYASNYLTYLQTCAWMFAWSTLAYVLLLWFLAKEGFSWRVLVRVAFMGHPMTPWLQYFHVMDLQIIVTTIGLILLFFTLLLQVFARTPSTSQSNQADEEKMARTVWLHGIPKGEANRLFPKPFRMDYTQWRGVQQTLRDSLEEHLRRRQMLEVRVLQATNLPDLVQPEMKEHENDVSDPFVRISLGNVEYDTHIVMNNLNPKWNTNVPFEFPIGLGDMAEVMTLEVLDANVAEKDSKHRFFKWRENGDPGTRTQANASDSLGYVEETVLDLRREGKDEPIVRELVQRVDRGKIDNVPKLEFEVNFTSRFGCSSDSNRLFGLSCHAAVDEVVVTPVLEDYLRTEASETNAQEHLVAWKERLVHCESRINALSGCGSWLDRFCWRRRRDKAEKKIAMYKALYASYQKEHAETMRRKFRLSGSAFVTFTDKAYAEELMREKGFFEGGNISMFYRTYTYWSFGQIPFSSVTLKCNNAPHPDDILWQNLHIPEWQRLLRFWSLTVVLFAGMSFLVSSTLVMTSVDTIKQLADLERQLVNESSTLNPTAPPTLKDWHEDLHYLNSQAIKFLGRLVAAVPPEALANMADQLPSLLLLLINGLLLPTLIQVIAILERGPRKSTMEVRQVFLNLVFLCLNSIILPFFGETYLNQVLSKLTQQLMDSPVKGVDDALGHVQTSMQASTGLFTLRFLLNAAFVSAGWNLCQLPQVIYHFVATRLAFTERQRREGQEAWPFAWGYWYAWTLSNFVLALFTTILSPSVLPLSAFSFYLRYKVDKYNLDNRIFSVGEVWDSTILARVVFYIRLAVCLWWILAGFIFLHVSCGELENMFDGQLSPSMRFAVRAIAVAHVGLGFILLVGAWFEKRFIMVAWERKMQTKSNFFIKVLLAIARCMGLPLEARHDDEEEQGNEEVRQSRGVTWADDCASDLSWNRAESKAFTKDASDLSSHRSRASTGMHRAVTSVM